MFQNKEQVPIKARHIIQTVKGRNERLVDCLKSTGEIRTGRYGCTGEEVTDRVKNGRTERKRLGRYRGHGGAGGVFLKHNEPHSSKKINNKLDLLFDLLLRKVFKGPFF